MDSRKKGVKNKKLLLVADELLLKFNFIVLYQFY